MRAMQITELGQPLALREVAPPQPKPNEALLRIRACGLNFADTLMVAGRYQEKPDLPFAPGLEVCATVEAAAADGSGPAEGSRVVGHLGRSGLAEMAAAPAHRLYPVPDAMPDAEVAGFFIAYGTSHVALAQLAQLKAGETLVVLGASGGVGLTAVEIGHLMGARVIAVARGPDKLAVAEMAGADILLDSTSDVRTEIKALGGADVLYDPVGGDLFTAAFRACRPGARILPIGFASGAVPEIPANILLVKNQSVFGLYFGAYADLHPEAVQSTVAALSAWYAAGRLKPHVSNVLPLEQANEGLDLLRNRTATGKVVIEIAGTG